MTTQPFSADADAVFEALTTADGLASCWTDQLDVASDVGSIARLGFGPSWAVVYEFRINRLDRPSAVEWTCVAGAEEWIGTVVRWAIEPEDDGVRVRFEHDGWADETGTMASCAYVWGSILERLVQYCETGRRNPIYTTSVGSPAGR